MYQPKAAARLRTLAFMLFIIGLALCGCQTIRQELSDRLTHWNMLGQDALDDPIKAVGGDGMVFTPTQESRPLNRKQLAAADAETLVNYFAPIFVQQRVNTQVQKYPYPPEYDMIGQAHLRREEDRKLTSYVAGSPTVYAIYKKLLINGNEHVQLTYTAWYPAHPKMQTFDLGGARHAGCRERPALFGAPEKDKKYSVERTVKDSIYWEIAGIVDEPRDQPHRPVVFLKAGDHKVIGMGSASRLRVPPTAEKHPYSLASYADLYNVNIDGSKSFAAFFDMEDGGKVRGAERKNEKFFLSFIGVDSAGQPRADDQIKMHFDESTWGDPRIYGKHLRLPPGAL
jgi:hypothetical protein